MRESLLAALGRGALIAVLSFQIVVGARPWQLVGGWRPQLASASAEADSSPTPAPEGSSPGEQLKADLAAGFDYNVDTNRGAFMSSIPIATPPGRRGVEPKLALTYNSASGSPSAVGVGWDLPLSSVRLDAHRWYLGIQEYHLDGQRLLLDGAGNYATEQDSYARIRKTCDANGCTFTADDRSGLRLRFGGSAESRQLARWGLDRVEDAHGNYMTISYMTDSDFVSAFSNPAYRRDGALLPREIRYTGSASRAPWYAVRFDYELRPQRDDYYYQSGWAPERLRYRIKAIRVVGADDVLIRAYTLSYTMSATGRSLLAGVALTGLNGATGPQPFSMTYVASPTGFSPATTLTPAPKDSRVVVGDFNGDGRSDLVTYRRTEANGTNLRRWRVQLGTASGLGDAAIWLTGHNYDFPDSGGCGSSKDAVFAGDWDGDGDTDLFHYSAGCGAAPRWRVLVASYDHFEVRDWIPEAQTGWGSAFEVGEGKLAFADFNADGRTDALIYRGAQQQDSTLVLSLAAAPGYQVVATQLGGVGLAGVGDFNGDRQADVLTVRSDGAVLEASCPISLGSFFQCGQLPFSPTSSLTLGEFNGDGLTDVLLKVPGVATLYTSSRSGFQPYQVNASVAGKAGDVDGDGRDDLVVPVDLTGTGQWVMRTWLQRGTVFMTGSSAGFPDAPMAAAPPCALPQSPNLTLADFTGDGRADPLLRLRDNTGGLCLNGESLATATDAPAVDRLATIRTPTGLMLQAMYQRSVEVGTPLTLPVVKELWVRDFPRLLINRVVSPILETHRYTFSTNKWDAGRGELMGFYQGRDETVERDLTVTTSYFQDVPRRGRTSAIAQTKTSTGELLTSDQYRYRDDTLPPYRTELAWHLRMYWSAGIITERSLRGFGYDDHGNLTRLEDHGLCSRTDDDRTTATTYRTAADFTISRPAQVDLYAGAPTPPASLGGFAGGCTGSSQTLLESTRHEYDGTASSVVRGDVTRTSKLRLGAGGPSWRMVREYTYRGDGLLTSTRDARGYTTSVLSFDPTLDLYPQVIRNAVGNDETHLYEPHFGKASRVTDANGNARTITYDPFGRPASVRTPLAQSLWMNTSTLIYGDGFPNWTARVTPYQGAGGALQGAAAVEFRDALGRTIGAVQDGDAMTERVVSRRATYWGASKLPTVILPPVEVAVPSCGATLTCLATWATSQPSLIDWRTLTAAPGTPAVMSYDPLGRAVRRDNPDGSFVSYAHTVDTLGFGLTQLDELGDERRVYRDAHGNIARVERWASAGAPAVTSYTHDARGNLTTMYSALGVKTTMTWDSTGQLTHHSSPELGDLSFGYDDDGHEVTRTDARGVTTSTTVDGLGRPTLRTTSDGGAEMWVYDRDPFCFGVCVQPPASDNTMGRPWAVIDAAGVTTLAYDGDGHLARETRAVENQTLTTSYVTWPTGQVVSKTYPDGERHDFAMAPDGQQAELRVGNATAPTVTMTRDALGRMATMQTSSGVTTTVQVDPLTLRITNLKTYDGAGDLAQQLEYEYRPDGVVEAIHRSDALSGGEDLYLTHDGVKRVTDVYVAPEVKDAEEHYAYDADGRMQVRKDRGQAPVAVGHTDPQHPNAVTSVGTRSFAHDASGNRIEEADGDATTRKLEYDGHGRLDDVDGGAATYVYDADGRRVIERGPSGTRIVVGGYTLEPDGTTRKVLQLGGNRVGERVNVAGSSTNRFFHTDVVGSVIGETDHLGRFDTSRTFSAFGVPVAQQGAGSRFGFGGYSVDDVTGLSFASARYYDPTTASYTQPDSWLYGFDDPEVLNGYAYAANSPQQYSDPSGHILVPALVAFGLSFAIGLLIDAEAADWHPDWSYIVIKNLVIAGVSAGTTYGLAYGLPALEPGIPKWAATLIGKTVSGFVTAGVVQAFSNQETHSRGGSTYTMNRGLLAGFISGAIQALGSGGFEIWEAPLTAWGVIEMMYVRDAVANNPDAKYDPRWASRRTAPAAAARPPTCGRAQGDRTMPAACEQLLQ